VEEKGLYLLLKNFNLSLYAIFGHAPSYIGKIFLGSFYGLIIGFILALWKREIIYNGLIIFFSLIFLHKLNCIEFNWPIIQNILGIKELSFSSQLFFSMLNTYAIEIASLIFVTILVKKTIRKYRFTQL
jgi:hypothetical protein